MIIRQATPADAELLCIMINELAAYEALSDESHPDPRALAVHLGAAGEGGGPHCHALIAEVDGEAAGFALYYHAYSTFLTNWGVFLEDLFVRPTHRKQGLGFALLQSLAARTVEAGGQRLEWNVLTWNRLALDFYERIGAKPMDEWKGMRLANDALRALAAGSA